ncbi:LPS export ABC transporter periplasmic protein LptC [Candidatus Latescibacterota bacterium]
MKHEGCRPKRHTVRLAALVAAAFLSWAGCAPEPTVTQLSTVPENEPDQKFIQARIVITEGGMTNAIVMADSIQVFLDRSYTEIDGDMAIDFFNDGGEMTTKLTADSGEIWGLYEEVDSLIARGDVMVVSVDEENRLETSSALTWSARTHLIYADGLVRLSTPDAVEQGINFVATDDLSEYSMDNVSGEYEGSGLSLPGR